MSLQRKLAVLEGRAMVRVRYIKTHDLATIGICPACWNIKKRRATLLFKLQKMGLEVAHHQDRLDGTYRLGKKHAPGCPYQNLNSNPWDEFKSVIKKYK
jgi:hypothetical protein